MIKNKYIIRPYIEPLAINILLTIIQQLKKSETYLSLTRIVCYYDE